MKTPLAQLLQMRSFTLVLAIGLTVLLSLDYILAQNYQRDQTFRLNMTAQRLQAQLSSAFSEHIAALLSINVVYQNFVDINKNDFEQYGKSISAHLPGFSRLLFVTPDYRISQIYPSSPENNGLYGTSLKSNPMLYDILQQAKVDKKENTTGLIPFLGQKKSLLAILPVYREGKAFLGFAVGEIDVASIWQTIYRNEYFNHYQVQLIDSNQTPYFDGVHLSALNNGDDPSHFARAPFYVTGKQWIILLEYFNAFDALFFERVGLWSAGVILLTFILLLIARNSTHKTAFGEAQKKFETIFHSSPDAIALLDNKLHFQLANPTLSQWTKLDEDELRSKTFFDVFRCQCPHLGKCRDLSFMLCTSDKFDQELPERLEVDIKNRVEDAPVKLRFNASRIKRRQGGIQEEGFICLLGDISASKELERHKETYVATLTHDLKTPLLAQEMVLDSLLSGATGNISESQEKLLYASKQSIHDLLDMVSDSLLFYKLESNHGISITKSQQSINALIQEVLDPIQPLATSRGLKFEVHTPKEAPRVWVDATQIKRVFRNVISNAISYAQRDTIIRINISTTEDSRLQVQITNVGKGILPQELPRIFEKHYSLSRKFKQIGTGLGLYISKRIVELHNGKIWATSEPDKETNFYIELPMPVAVLQ
ncbi:MAG: ATP-binding protein [Vampirovibrionales bacterium]|nr:ATP-binding protein [Vampirovibrionales bacterium]